ncbi:Nucleotidylyl transferase [Acephala macrosclerotiorum]|nr:Nucleotidylyl transferase [Acephala macrosclerotiorum]
MATPASIRLPWRAIVRSATKPQSSHLLQASRPATLPIRQQTRYSSYTPFDPPGSSTPVEELDVLPPRPPANPRYPSQTAPQSQALLPERAPNAPPQEITQDSDSSALLENDIRLPRSVQAVYLRPLRRKATYGVPTCDLQLRSYSIRNLEFFCDFALRAAYYLGLPAYGPVTLPRITERWTVPKGSFIHKKSQENFERRTVRRLIQIKDGEAETQEVWLAFLRKHAYYGIGMKANVWEFSKLGVGKEMDAQMEQMKDVLEPTLDNLAFNKKSPLMLPSCSSLRHRLLSHPLRALTYSYQPQHALPISQTRHNSSSTSPPRPQVIFSGIQPTGIPHLGNYLGALQNWVKLQNSAAPETKLLYSIVDLHAITVPQNPAQLRRWKRESLATLLAVGLSEEKSILFFQSDVQAHSELMWILSCTASMGYLSRMTQWKSKLALEEGASPLDESSKAKLKLGLFSYPVLQAADILVHRATHVPVGEDQSQHLEFARECVTNFNHTYGGDFLVAPQTILSPAKRIMSLTDPLSKMSKSATNPSSRILITDSPSTIKKKLASALTDSSNSVSYSRSLRPGVTNLLHLLSAFDSSGKTAEELGNELEGSGIGLGAFKSLVADAVSEGLRGVRERFERVMGDEGSKVKCALEGNLET